MEPKSVSPEYLPPQNGNNYEQQQGSEQSPEVPSYKPEVGPEQQQEQKQQVAPTQPEVDPSQIALPTPVQPVPNQDDSTVSTDDMPQVAADEDLIEKEWVDKAKQIITETKEDPHLREKEVGKLQADYLKKRYGKDLGEAA